MSLHALPRHASALRSLAPAPTRSRLIRDCNVHAQPPHRLFWSSFPARQQLAGTAPAHSAYVLLHTHAPPAAYPPKSKSPLWRALTLKGREWGAVANFAWSPEQEVHPAYSGLGEGPRSEGEREREAYVASVFSTSRRGRVLVPEVTLANVDALRDAVAAAPAQETDRLFLYVCTHGSRDCRCGDGGGEVVRALRAEIAKRGVERDVFVGEVAHVGGHKYAANVLVYPYGDWLGTVQAVDVPQILDELLAFHDAHRSAETLTDLPPLCPPFWRGRMGLDKDQQLALISRSKPV
ncbi:Sucrase/ferredoxin-like-domain-containing protein [Cerioporus squamosus]|nr:Sucrase/ferredoxin-like-domain-containing protein [Cerioporus squamosus]